MNQTDDRPIARPFANGLTDNPVSNGLADGSNGHRFPRSDTKRTKGQTDGVPARPPSPSYTRNISNNNNNIYIQEAHSGRAGEREPCPFDPLVRLPLRLVKADDHPDPDDDLPPAEPTDEELWLADVARQVEADARPLFAAIWIWLLQRALEAEGDEPA